ncbi:hypothetical protein K439DRAFT_1521226 [Ramaria rubella]|nr:hypothetical protein K439DRAFT_1521226 [Ramaria rubella]
MQTLHHHGIVETYSQPLRNSFKKTLSHQRQMVLVPGCGRNYNVVFFASLHYRVVGLDLSLSLPGGMGKDVAEQVVGNLFANQGPGNGYSIIYAKLYPTMRASKKYTGRSPSQVCGIAKRAKGVVRDSEADDDGKYNSTATVAEVLQAISKHIHYGKFVSVSKCIEKPSDLIPHSLNPNRKALEALITKPAVD